MKILFVAGSLFLSKAIMGMLDEPVSHFAILFDDKIVFHSDLSGTHISWYEDFLKTHKVVFEIDHTDTTLDLQEEVYQNILATFDGKWYDFGAFAYFIWRGLLWKLFNRPLPAKNPWRITNTFLCTELAEVLPDSMLPPAVKALDLSITSPYQLWLAFNKT